jgi:hypothetical protein
MARFAESTYGARLSVPKKVAEARPSARLGALAEPIKKSIARHVDAEPGIVDWAFFSKFPNFFLFEKYETLETTLVSALFLERKSGLVAPLRPPWCIGRAHKKIHRPAR